VAPPAPPDPGRSRRPNPWVAAGGLAVTAALVAVLLTRGGGDDGRETLPPEASTTEVQPRTTEGTTAPTTTADPAPPLWQEQFFNLDVVNRWSAAGGRGENASIVPDPDGPRTAVLRIDSSGDNSGLTGFGMDLRPGFDDMGIEPMDEAWLRYDLYLPDDFDFYAGGKLPGLSGISDGIDPYSTSAGGEYRSTSWSGRILWHPEGELTSYLYVPHAGGMDLEESFNPDNGQVYGISGRWRQDGTGAVMHVTKGKWHSIDLHYRMNTPGKNDGLFEGYLDTRLGIRLDDVQYRDADHPDLSINQLFLSTFFGGPTANETDQTWYLDDLAISATPREGLKVR
jgi:hypothetical protein